MIMRLKQFLLNEKVSAMDWKDAMNDPNILIGLEFEYHDDNLAEYTREIQTYSVSDIDFLSNDYEGLLDKISKLIDEVTKFRKGIQAKYSAEAEIKYSTAVIEHERLEKEFKALPSEKQDKWDVIHDEIDKLATKIKIYKNYMRYVELYMNAEKNLYTKHMIIDKFKSKIPKIPKKLADYWADTTNYDKDELDPLLLKVVAAENMGIIYSNLGDPAAFDLDNMPTPFIPWIERCTNALNVKDLPSYVKSNYKISLDNPDYSKWLFTFDGSLGIPEGGGLEIISPPIPITKISGVVKDMFNYIKNNGSTNEECGLHCNLSYKGKVMHKDVDLFKLMLFMEEGWVYKNFPDRERNEWVHSMLQTLDNTFHVARTMDLQFGENPFKKDMKKTPVKKYWDLFYPQLPNNSHYNSVSWTSIMKKEASRIEVRWLGGKNYDTKYKEVIEGIGKFAHYLKLSLDPSYKWQDYVKKLWRMFTDKNNADPLQYKKEEAGFKFRSILRRNGKLIGSHKENGETYLYYDYKGFTYKYNVEPKHKTGIPVKYMKTDIFYKKLDKGNFLKGFKL